MLSKVIIIVIEFMFLGINIFWAKMSLSRALNIFMPANINSIVIFYSASCDYLYKLSGQPSSSLEDAESLSSHRSTEYLVRKKSATLRVAANGNSRTVLPSSPPKSDKKMSRFAIEPSAHSQEVSSSTEPLACESLGVLKTTSDKMNDLDSAAEKEGRSKLVGSPNARVSAMGKWSVA